jgi:hypothetical protein
LINTDQEEFDFVAQAPSPALENASRKVAAHIPFSLHLSLSVPIHKIRVHPW